MNRYRYSFFQNFFEYYGNGSYYTCFLFFIYQQRKTISALSDNDLKYRYIKAYNQIDSISIVQLEDIFEYNRKPELIKRLHKDVEQFEHNVKGRVERLEEARLNEKKAEALQQEADKLKK